MYANKNIFAPNFKFGQMNIKKINPMKSFFQPVQEDLSFVEVTVRWSIIR